MADAMTPAVHRRLAGEKNCRACVHRVTLVGRVSKDGAKLGACVIFNMESCRSAKSHRCKGERFESTPEPQRRPTRASFESTQGKHK